MGRRRIRGVLWLSLDDLGEVRFSFNDVMAAMRPYYALRLVAGLLFPVGRGPHVLDLHPDFAERSTVTVAAPAGSRRMRWVSLHRRLERKRGC